MTDFKPKPFRTEIEIDASTLKVTLKTDLEPTMAAGLCRDVHANLIERLGFAQPKPLIKQEYR